jgi:hypothetical protein
VSTGSAAEADTSTQLSQLAETPQAPRSFLQDRTSLVLQGSLAIDYMLELQLEHMIARLKPLMVADS